MQTLTDDSLVTADEAADHLRVDVKTVRRWRDTDRLAPRGTRKTFRHGAPPLVYRLGDVKALVAQTRTPTVAAVPEGHVTILVAATQLGVATATISNWFDKGRLTGVTRKQGSRTVRFVSKECLEAAPPRQSGYQTKANDAADMARAIDNTPVLYGLLTRADAAELARRRAKLEARTHTTRTA